MLQPGTKEFEALYRMASPELKAKMQVEAAKAKNGNPMGSFADMFGTNPFGGLDSSQFSNIMGGKK